MWCDVREYTVLRGLGVQIGSLCLGFEDCVCEYYTVSRLLTPPSVAESLICRLYRQNADCCGMYAGIESVRYIHGESGQSVDDGGTILMPSCFVVYCSKVQLASIPAKLLNM